MELGERLKPYCDALVKGMEDENWYLALMAALTLPDICTSLEGSEDKDDYIAWFDEYVTQYTIKIYRGENDQVTTLPDGGTITSRKKTDPVEVVEEHVFFTGVMAYALRCAFLHNGDGELANQRMSGNEKYRNFMLGIKKVKFLAKNSTNLSIERIGEDTIRLNPRHYCQAILDGVDEWIKSIEKDNKRKEKVLYYIKNLIVFE